MSNDFNTTRFYQNLKKFYWLSSRGVILEISRRVKGGMDIRQKDKKRSQNDKTRHGREKQEKDKVKVQAQVIEQVAARCGMDLKMVELVSKCPKFKEPITVPEDVPTIEVSNTPKGCFNTGNGNDGKGGMKPISFVYILKDNTYKNTVKIVELSNDKNVEGVDVAIPLHRLTREGMEQVLENNPWLIRLILIILNIWTPKSRLKKDEITVAPVWGLESVSKRRIQWFGYGVLGFLRVGTTFDIFQNIHILYLQYGVLVFSGYGVFIMFPLWSLVSAGMDTPYLP
ncbi:hypothetical protein Tco_1400189 [Tanacetum coccineum]